MVFNTLNVVLNTLNTLNMVSTWCQHGFQHSQHGFQHSQLLNMVSTWCQHGFQHGFQHTQHGFQHPQRSQHGLNMVSGSLKCVAFVCIFIVFWQNQQINTNTKYWCTPQTTLPRLVRLAAGAGQTQGMDRGRAGAQAGAGTRAAQGAGAENHSKWYLEKVCHEQMTWETVQANFAFPMQYCSPMDSFWSEPLVS